MRHLTCAFALLSAVLFTAGCKTTGPGPNEPVDNPSYRDAGQAGSDAGKAPTATPDTGTQGMALGREAREACVDRWLTGRKLDRFGHPEGTMYTGGTPLFDERTGESRDRLEYIFERHPEARQACPEAAR